MLHLWKKGSQKGRAKDAFFFFFSKDAFRLTLGGIQYLRSIIYVHLH